MKSFLKFCLLLVLMCPISIFATVTFSSAKNIARFYYVTFKDSYYFNSTGLLSKYEFEIESSEKKQDGSVVFRPSYLNSTGLEFWTSDQVPGDTKAYVIKEGLNTKYTGATSGVRVVANVKKEVTVSGSGSLYNPWVFDDVKQISFYTNDDFSKGWLSDDIDCSFDNLSFKHQNITLSVMPGTIYDIFFCAREGYKVTLDECDIKNNLTSYMDGRYEIVNIFDNSSDKMECKIRFDAK